MTKLTQERLKELFYYNPDEGTFTRLVTRGGRALKDTIITGCPNSDGYLQICIDGKSYLSHRLGFLYKTGKFPEQLIDHINGIKGDNRWFNLREVTQSINMRNAKKRSDNTSGINGVRKTANGKKWLATVKVGKKHISLGTHDTIELANQARLKHNVANQFTNNHGL